VTRSSRRRRRTAILAADRWERLKTRGARRGLTSSVLLAAAFAEVLGAWSGDRGDRFTLNVTFNRRAPRHPDVELLLGDFTTTILLEVDRRPPGFEARARRLLERFTADLDHAAVSGVEVLRRRQRQRQESAVAAMPVVFTSLLGRREGRGEVLFSSNWLGEPVYGLSQTPQVSLDNMVYECEDGLGVVWDALEEAYPDGVLDAMFAAYIGSLERLAAPEEEAAWTAPRLDWVPPAQRASREEVNATAACLPVDLLHSGFERQARLRPEAVAVEAPGRRLSYGELDRLSALLAAALRRRGAAPNRLVAVVMEKGWEQAVAVLGILRAGAAYLPIGAELPASRVHELLARGEVALAVTQARVDAALDWPAGVTRLCVEDLAEPEEEGGAAPPVPVPPAARPDDLAYVIFTSGSTGRPKGVMISHRAALNTVLDVNRRFDVGPGDRLLALSSLSFDLSVWDLFGLFAAGGAVVFPAAGTERDPEHWAERMAAAGVTLWDSVPALLRMQVEHAAGRMSFPDLRLVLLSGDWIPVTLPEEVRRVAPGARVISLGGATEASIWSILWPADQVDPAWPSLPYGKPMAGQTFEVLSPGLSPCPDWVTGELAIGGAGVAMGYWGDAVETASRFVPDPAAREAGGRMFLTGDLGRWMGDGNLEILGREDFQVKIQGYRVELGEIEAALRQCPGVLDAVAVALAEGSDPRGQKRLVAYVVPEDGTMPPEPMLREFLAERLPPLMVPAAYLPLPALPLSSNGKVDRSRLPPPVFSALAAGSAGRDGEAGGPRDEVERLLVAAVEEILARSGVRPGDRFVDLGCTSVNMVQIHRRLRGRVPREISVPQMFRHPTVRALAEALRGERETAPEALEAGRAILGRTEVARRRLLARDGVS
jgi:amino acid adenylation domain-containing protein